METDSGASERLIFAKATAERTVRWLSQLRRKR